MRWTHTCFQQSLGSLTSVSGARLGRDVGRGRDSDDTAPDWWAGVATRRRRRARVRADLLGPRVGSCRYQARDLKCGGLLRASLARIRQYLGARCHTHRQCLFCAGPTPSTDGGPDWPVGPNLSRLGRSGPTPARLTPHCSLSDGAVPHRVRRDVRRADSLGSPTPSRPGWPALRSGPGPTRPSAVIMSVPVLGPAPG